MAATRTQPPYINGDRSDATAHVDDGRIGAFYEKVIQLHKDVVAGKNSRFASSAAPLHSRTAFSSSIPAAAHAQTDSAMSLPGLNNQPKAPSQPKPLQVSTSAAGASTIKPQASSAHSAVKPSGAAASKPEPVDEALRMKRIKEARQKLERSIAEYAKADEPILKNAREIPLNLLALAQAQVAPVSGFQSDPSEDSFDADSYYSSKANSWSTENSDAQVGRTDAAIVISDEDDLYEPPSQVNAAMARAGQPPIPGIQNAETVKNGHGDWAPDWDEEDDYEPPTSAAFGHASTNVSQNTGYGHSQIPPPQNAVPVPTHSSQRSTRPEPQNNRAVPMPTIAVNRIPAPAAPQPSRISPLTTGNLTSTMQSHISNVQQAQGNQVSGHAGNNKDAKKAKKLARKEAKAAAIEERKKRKRGASPDRQHDKKGKRRAVEQVPASPGVHIKSEPVSPTAGLPGVPSRRPSVVHRAQPEPPTLSSPYNGRPRSSYVSDQEQSPRGRTYADQTHDRIAMPPPQVVRRDRDSQDLRRVASLQYARRPMSPPQEQPVYADPRPPPRYAQESAPRYIQEPGPIAQPPLYRDGSARPPSVRPGHSPPLRLPAYGRSPPRPGDIVEDAYGNRYIAEVVPDEYPPPSRRHYAEDYEIRYVQPRRPQHAYEDDRYRLAPPPQARAYSHVPEPAPEHQPRAYSRVPEPVSDPRPYRAYSIAPQHEPRQEIVYAPRPVASRYDEYGSPRAIAPPQDYAQPPPRAYSVRPDGGQPEYAAPRAGSMAPVAYGRPREMVPPTVPVARAPENMSADPGYRYAEDARPQYDDRRVVSYRY